MSVDLIFVLDESESMKFNVDSYISHFNSLLQNLKISYPNSFFSLVKFNNKITPFILSQPISKVQELKKGKDYNPNNGTALYDTLYQILSKKSRTCEYTIFIIITDGIDTMSRSYNYVIKEQIENKEENDEFKFLFLGANKFALEEAKRLGIHNSLIFNENSDSINNAMKIIKFFIDSVVNDNELNMNGNDVDEIMNRLNLISI